MNKLCVRIGRAVVTYVVLDLATKGIDKCLDIHYKDKIKKGLKNGSYVEIDGKYYKVTVQEA
jgi:hypothetical protein